MVIMLAPELETAMSEQTLRRSVSVEAISLEALRERFLAPVSPIQPQDEWERHLLGLAKDCGVSLSDAALSREALYE